MTKVKEMEVVNLRDIKEEYMEKFGGRKGKEGNDIICFNIDK